MPMKGGGGGGLGAKQSGLVVWNWRVFGPFFEAGILQLSVQSCGLCIRQQKRCARNFSLLVVVAILDSRNVSERILREPSSSCRVLEGARLNGYSSFC
ncbi:hypothetical protein BV898_18752 [Hypsibius exemplaris]|uniref:Uncharacterized protein n=1 Tax=Hypsibius exemplaris TaxID=2072580 RepID=A0A9X6NJG0_HYPEX|nr:hypothetical protein BV898_18752 [Hypsibius exemplaris]